LLLGGLPSNELVRAEDRERCASTFATVLIFLIAYDFQVVSSSTCGEF
jgi:hypothetical protein